MTTFERQGRAYLVPRTLGCPGICWKRPRVTIIDNPAGPYVEVLVDGEHCTRNIHITNLSKSLPRGTEPGPPVLGRPPKPLQLAPGMEEVPLW